MKTLLNTQTWKTALGIITGVMLSTSTFAAEENPLAKYLAVPGAKTTLPVGAAKKAFPLEFVNDARAKFENFHYQMGGDHALYYNGHLSEMMPCIRNLILEKEG